MQIAYIAPKSMAKHTIAGDFHFLIPQNATGWYRSSRNFKMLDNGAYEGGAISFDELIELAAQMKVDEVVIPDVIKDAEKTLSNIAMFAKELSDEFRVAVVPQGQTIEEFLECFSAVMRYKHIDTICFPKWLGSMRPAVIHLLYKQGKLKYMYEYHLMGLDNLAELFCYDNFEIRSVDTSMPFTYAYHMKRISAFKPIELKRVPMSAHVFDDARTTLLKYNCDVMRNVIGSL